MKPNFSQGESISPDNSPLERFNLLSAYLDNQVTTAERQQVQKLLDTDPEFKKTYLQMLKIEQGLKNLPVSSTGVTAEVICEKVFAKIDIQQKNRMIGLLVSLGFIITLGFFCESPWRFQQTAFKPNQDDGLTIALNRPILKLPHPLLNQPDSITTP